MYQKRIIFSPCDFLSHSVDQSVLQSVRPLYFLGIFRAVFASLFLPDQMRLMLLCIRPPPLPLRSRLLLLPNPRNLYCRVNGLVSFVYNLQTMMPKLVKIVLNSKQIFFYLFQSKKLILQYVIIFIVFCKFGTIVTFLDASLHLYKRKSLSVCPLVGRSVGTLLA